MWKLVGMFGNFFRLSGRSLMKRALSSITTARRKRIFTGCDASRLFIYLKTKYG